MFITTNTNQQFHIENPFKTKKDEITKNNNNMIFEKKDIQNGDYGLFERNFISFDKKQTILVKNYDTLIPWITPKTRESNGMLKLHYEIIDFYNFMAPTEEEDLLKKETIRYFKNLIKDN